MLAWTLGTIYLLFVAYLFWVMKQRQHLTDAQIRSLRNYRKTWDV